MTRLWLRPAIWIVTTLGSAAIAFSAGQFEMEPGERVLHSKCVECHDLRPIETRALDEDGWGRIVILMKEREGAEIKDEDARLVVKFLAAAYGPLPEGPGKAIMLNICTQCHSLDRVKARAASREEWDETLMHMLNEGAPLTDRDYPVILDYLARYFR